MRAPTVFFLKPRSPLRRAAAAGALLLAATTTTPALADCVSPAGVAGQIGVWGAPPKPYFCDGDRWFEMNFVDATAAPPCAQVGEFAPQAGALRFCNGSQWLRQTPAALVLGTCATTGRFEFSPTTKVLSVCDGGVLRTAKLAAPSITFTATGAVQTYTVPAGVTRLTARLWGAGGGGGGGARKGSAGTPRTGGPGGGGAYGVAQFAVTPGETLNIYVGRGGAGGRALEHTFLIIFTSSYTASGGGGGGLTAIQRASDSSWLVALGSGGGGGGADEQEVTAGGRGGAGGISLGASGDSAASGSTGGGGGDVATGGAAGSGSSAAASGNGAARTGGSGGGALGTLDPAAFLNGGRPGLVDTDQLPTGGGGGAGAYGGGGGGASATETDVGSSGGGGGSAGLSWDTQWLYGDSGLGTLPGGFGMADRPLGIAEGGVGGSGPAAGTAGGNGLVILVPDPAP